MPYSPRRFCPSLETLEGRWTPAANVTAVMRGGSLMIHADNNDSSIQITQPRPGMFTISATDFNTRINRIAGPVSFRVTGDVHIGLGGGTDTVVFGSGKGELMSFSRGLYIEGVGGNKTVQALADLNVRGNLEIKTTTGNDTIELTGKLNVTGNVNIFGGTGDNTTAIAPSSGVNTLKGRLFVTNQFGSSTTAVFDTNVTRDLNLSNSGEADGSTDIVFGVSSASVKANVGGNVTLRTSHGSGSIRLLDSDVRGHAMIYTGELGFSGASFQDFTVDVGPFLIDSDAVIRGNLRLYTDGPTAITLGTLAEGVDRGLSVGGNMVARGGDGDDSLRMLKFSLGSDMQIVTRGGADLVSSDDSIFRGLVQISTGDGFDTVRLERHGEAQFSGSTQFAKSVNIDLGAGDDSMLLGEFGNDWRKVVLGGTARFDGGLGFDIQELASNLVNLGTPNGNSPFVNFES